MDWTFVTEDSKTNVNWKRTNLENLVYELIREGAEYCSDIAEGLNRSKVEICRHAKRLINDNFIKKKGQKYVLAEYNVVEITPPK